MGAHLYINAYDRSRSVSLCPGNALYAQLALRVALGSSGFSMGSGKALNTVTADKEIAPLLEACWLVYERQEDLKDAALPRSASQRNRPAMFPNDAESY
jgi:hypothetical protein